ncbi:hypothetical protein PA10_00260 [Pseudomonas phage pPa_SNUABM_DT01]|nr:hypothetical protein PA10_00260 [Pseudomonas phage pPa_SNUABM_DT01]
MLDFSPLTLAIQRFTDNIKTLLSSAPVVYVGEYKGWAPSTIPTGWLLCDGSAVSRTEYADLFAEIGVAFGAGDGSTTFNLPDFRGRVPRGLTDLEAMGSTGGSDDVVLVEGNLPAHAHALGAEAQADTVMKLATTEISPVNVPTSTKNVFGPAFSGRTPVTTYTEPSSLASGEANYGSITTDLSGDTSTVGSGDPVDITPSYIGLRWIIAAVGVRATAVA